jgi:hypothetical protein
VWVDETDKKMLVQFLWGNPLEETDSFGVVKLKILARQETGERELKLNQDRVQ